MPNKQHSDCLKASLGSPDPGDTVASDIDSPTYFFSKSSIDLLACSRSVCVRGRDEAGRSGSTMVKKEAISLSD